MPELPEVETIRRGLELKLPGQAITGIKVDWLKSLPTPGSSTQLIGAKVESIDRRGKVLIIHLSNGRSLLTHLKMTGQLVLASTSGERFAGGHPTQSMSHQLPDRSTRVSFEFESGDRLFFNDQRKFGWIKLVPRAEIVHDPLLARMGPEPLSKQFTLTGFQKELKSHARAPVKAVILDQSTVAGVGNIYADEALHLAKIHPARLAGSLDADEAAALHQAIQTVIKQAISFGGTSVTNYVNALGKKGDYLQHARVFHRTGQACGECGTPIEKIRVAGRGTHVCPNCQPRP